MNSIGITLLDALFGFGAGYGIYKTTESLVCAIIIGISFSLLINFIRTKIKKSKK